MLYAFGSNGQEQLGVGHSKDIASPEPSAHLQLGAKLTVRQIAAGGNHTLILDSDGHITAYGSNGIGQRADRRPANVAHVSATWNASVFLCQTGEVMTAGEGLSGELGLGKGVTEVLCPQLIADFPPRGTSVVQIASGLAHTVVVLCNGDVYGWGKVSKGQLGELAEDVWSPRKIDGIPFPVVKAVCGKDYTCFIADRKDGRMIILGLNSRDRFSVKASKPAAVPGWKDIAASWGSVFILMQNGELIGFGRDDHGQLPPADLPPIEAIAAGSEHCVALTKAGKVLAWGWGEHGNCGEPTDANGDVKGRWNEIEVPTLQRVTAVYAGCATSFIVTADAARIKHG